MICHVSSWAQCMLLACLCMQQADCKHVWIVVRLLRCNTVAAVQLAPEAGQSCWSYCCFVPAGSSWARALLRKRVIWQLMWKSNSRRCKPRQPRRRKLPLKLLQNPSNHSNLLSRCHAESNQHCAYMAELSKRVLDHISLQSCS